MSDSILQQILAHKVIEVARQRSKVSDTAIQHKATLAPPVRSFAAALRRHQRPTSGLFTQRRRDQQPVDRQAGR